MDTIPDEMVIKPQRSFEQLMVQLEQLASDLFRMVTVCKWRQLQKVESDMHKMICTSHRGWLTDLKPEHIELIKAHATPLPPPDVRPKRKDSLDELHQLLRNRHPIDHIVQVRRWFQFRDITATDMLRLNQRVDTSRIGSIEADIIVRGTLGYRYNLPSTSQSTSSREDLRPRHSVSTTTSTTPSAQRPVIRTFLLDFDFSSHIAKDGEMVPERFLDERVMQVMSMSRDTLEAWLQFWIADKMLTKDETEILLHLHQLHFDPEILRSTAMCIQELTGWYRVRQNDRQPLIRRPDLPVLEATRLQRNPRPRTAPFETYHVSERSRTPTASPT